MKRAIRGLACGVVAVVLVSAASGQTRRGTNGLGGVWIGRPTFIGQSSRPSFQRVPITAVVGGSHFGHSPSYGFTGVVAHHAGPIRHDASLSHGLGKGLSSDYGYYGGSGLRVHGSYGDDRLRVSLHLGSGYTGYYGSYYSGSYYGCYPYRRYTVPYYGYRSYDPYYYGTTTYYGSSPVGYPDAAVDPRVAIARYEPPAVEPEVAEPQDALGKARWNLMRENTGKAIKAYRDHLDEQSDDAGAMRELAIALMEAGQLPDAVAVLRLAYDTDPVGLADEPIEPGELLGYEGDRRLARLVRRSSIYANKTESASTWLAVGVLMQGQGRDRLALKMIVRAVAQGLDDAIAQPLTDALRRGGYSP